MGWPHALALLATAVLLNPSLGISKKREKLEPPPRDWKKGRVTEVGSETVTSRGSTTGTVDSYGNIRTDSGEVRRIQHTFVIDAGNSVIVGGQMRRNIGRFPKIVWSKRCNVAMGDTVFFAIEGDALYILGRDDGKDCQIRLARQTLKQVGP
jgi:hypothetical protein